MNHLPLPTITAYHGGDPKCQDLRIRFPSAENGTLDGNDIIQVSGDAGAEDLVGTGQTVGETLREPVEDWFNLIPAASRSFRAEECHPLVMSPQRFTRAGVAVLQRQDLRTQQRDNLRNKRIDVVHGNSSRMAQIRGRSIMRGIPRHDECAAPPV